jgi:hypothetical protein
MTDEGIQNIYYAEERPRGSGGKEAKSLTPSSIVGGNSICQLEIVEVTPKWK